MKVGSIDVEDFIGFMCEGDEGVEYLFPREAVACIKIKPNGKGSVRDITGKSYSIDKWSLLKASSSDV